MTAQEAADAEHVQPPTTTTAAAAPLAGKRTQLPDGALVYEAPPFFGLTLHAPKWLQPVIEDVWSFTLIHYNIWALPVLVLFYYMYQVRIGCAATCAFLPKRC